MKRQVPKRLQDAERMVAATQRLEALLRNPGPGITVTPVVYEDEADGVDDGAADQPTAAAGVQSPQSDAAIDPDLLAQATSAAAPRAGLRPPSDIQPERGMPPAGAAAGRSTAARRLQEVLRQRAAAAAAQSAAGSAGASPAPAAPAGVPLDPVTGHPLRRADDTLPDLDRYTVPAETETRGAAADQRHMSRQDVAMPDREREPQLAAPLAPRVATQRNAGHASGTRPIERKPERTPSAPPAAAAQAPAVPMPASQTKPRSGIDRARATGFTGFVIDWLLAGNGEMKAAIAQSAPAFGATGLFSFVINILMLAGPLFMLQVYDRVMTSGSIPTLVALFAITAGLYAVIGVLELVRSRIVVRIGVEVDQRLSERIFRASLRRTLTSPGQALPALRELDNLRQFVASQGPITFFDAPWTPVYLIVIFLVHWVLGVTAVLGGALLVSLAWMSESRSRGPIIEAGRASGRSLDLADTGQRNAESITAMGMLSAYIARWQRANGEAIAWQTLATDRLGGMAAVSKGARLLLQSLMLAIGAWLAVKGEISAGSIIAGTIIFGRALAPVEQGITHWRGFLKARESYFKLADLLAREPVPPQKTALPTPKGHIEVTALRVAAPDTRQLILSNLNFRVEPGQMLAVIGPSASGKSTLARTLVGLWAPFSGVVELDGARLDQWDGEALGRHIGYLPQNVELFSGTVRDNISRFRTDASDQDVMAAAAMAHAHEMVLALPQGYDTELGNFGTYLSAGQRQRIGLARALFGNPAVIVLDEPNANLDRSGDEALSSAIDGCRARGQAVVLVSHRVQAIGKADLLLYLDRGMQRAFGPRAEVMKLFQSPNQHPASGAPQQAAQQAPGGSAAR